jgi:hypothetical protein
MSLSFGSCILIDEGYGATTYPAASDFASSGLQSRHAFHGSLQVAGLRNKEIKV